MNRHVLSLLWILVALATPAAQGQDWKDPSPHATRFITVDDGVRLEVLDWGGSGTAIVLLAGLGATAHQYDDFAPLLTDRYRVVGVTRRGHRGSSAVATGYGFDRLAEDVLRVIDTLNLSNPVVVGSSFAGEEMHVLGAKHAARVRALVYIDAAFDRGNNADSERYEAAARLVPAAPPPQESDRASFATFQEYLAKYQGVWPEAHVRTRYRTTDDGGVDGLWAPDGPILRAMTMAIRAAYDPYQPEPIRVPALAIYAAPTAPDDLVRRGSSDRAAFPGLAAMATADPALRERVDKLFQLTRARVEEHEKWFEGFAVHGRIVEISGSHDLVVSNAPEVLRHIETFLSSLPDIP